MDTPIPIPALPTSLPPSPAARLDRTLGRVLWVLLGLALILAS
jgi:hypothetical protein